MNDWMLRGAGRWFVVLSAGALAASASVWLRNDRRDASHSAQFAAAEASADRLLDVPVVTDGIAFPIATMYGPIDGAHPGAEQTAAYRPILNEEWSRYPAALMTRVRLARIILCIDLKFAGQKRSAVPDFEHDALLLDVAASLDQAYLRKVIHHEFYHLIDERDDGSLYADAEWNRLNPPDFSYGSGGKNMQDATNPGAWLASLDGVTSRYAAAGVEEDKAELFAFLMLRPADVAAEAKRDDVLAAKIELLKRQLELFCPELDAPFWKRIQSRSPVR